MYHVVINIISFDKRKPRNLLPALGFRSHFFYGGGYLGLPTYGLFDKIIVTAGASFAPEPLKQQLKVGGIMVIRGVSYFKAFAAVTSTNFQNHLKSIK